MSLKSIKFPGFFIGGAMPYRPEKPCSCPGCANLTDGR